MSYRPEGGCKGRDLSDRRGGIGPGCGPEPGRPEAGPGHSRTAGDPAPARFPARRHEDGGPIIDAEWSPPESTKSATPSPPFDPGCGTSHHHERPGPAIRGQGGPSSAPSSSTVLRVPHPGAEGVAERTSRRHPEKSGSIEAPPWPGREGPGGGRAAHAELAGDRPPFRSVDDPGLARRPCPLQADGAGRRLGGPPAALGRVDLRRRLRPRRPAAERRQAVPLFAFAGCCPGPSSSAVLQTAGGSVVGNAQLVTKVYFPRSCRSRWPPLSRWSTSPSPWVLMAADGVWAGWPRPRTPAAAPASRRPRPARRSGSG